MSAMRKWRPHAETGFRNGGATTLGAVGSKDAGVREGRAGRLPFLAPRTGGGKPLPTSEEGEQAACLFLAPPLPLAGEGLGGEGPVCQHVPTPVTQARLDGICPSPDSASSILERKNRLATVPTESKAGSAVRGMPPAEGRHSRGHGEQGQGERRSDSAVEAESGGEEGGIDGEGAGEHAQ